jgi:hypothetical protein
LIGLGRVHSATDSQLVQKTYLDCMSSCIFPSSTTFASLRDAIAYFAASDPEADHLMKEIQAAARCVTQVAENGGPSLFAQPE